MPNDLGISFVPGQSPEPTNGGQPSASPMQSAIRYLSLRLPKFTSQGAIAPGPLLSGPGSGGNPMANSALGQTQGQYLSSPMSAPGQSPDQLMEALLSLLGPNLPAAPQPLGTSPRDARHGPAPRPSFDFQHEPPAGTPITGGVGQAMPTLEPPASLFNGGGNGGGVPEVPQSAPPPAFQFKQPRTVVDVADRLYSPPNITGPRFNRQ